MGALFSDAVIRFRNPPGPATVGDPVSFQLEVKWEGGVTDNFMGGVQTLQYSAQVKRQATTFLLKNPQIVTNLGADNVPFDIRISVPDDSPLRVAREWDVNPKARQTMSEFSFYSANRQGTSQITAEAVDEHGSVVASDTFTVSVRRFVLSLEKFATQYLKVGDSCAPALVVNLPAGLPQVSTVGRLQATVIVPSDMRRMQFSDMQVFAEGGAPVEVPFNLFLTVDPDADGINPVFFKYPDPARDISLGDSGIFDGLPDYVVGRRYTESVTHVNINVQILVKPEWQESYVAADDQGFPIRILPHQLKLEFEAADAGVAAVLTGDTPELVLEDDWREEEQKLRGSFLIRATVGTRVVYSSDQLAVVGGTYTAEVLTIDRVVQRSGGAGETAPDRFHPSTQFTLVIDDPGVVEFDVTHLCPTPGSFSVVHEVTDWISAKRDGVANLSCKIEPPDISDLSKIPPDLVFWVLPKAPVRIRINVKEPLRAHLLTWVDTHFSGSGALPLDQGDPPDELIYSSGTLTGKVDNHNPASTQETIKVLVSPPSGQNPDTPVRAGQELQENGDVEVDIDSLSYDFSAGNGSNQLSLSAWKPINQVMDGGPDVATVTLKAVVPNSLEILQPPDGTTVRRTRIDNIQYRYARATLGLVADESLMLAEQSAETYLATTRDTGAVNLSATAGDHTINLFVYNEFNDLSTEQMRKSITIHAPAPSISVDFQLPQDKSMAPNKVGHSVPSVPATVTVTNATRTEIWQNGTVLQSIPMASGTAAALTEQHNVTLPPSGVLADGDNVFEFHAINDFATTTRSVTISRRAKLFETIGDPNMSFEARPLPDNLDETVYVGVTANFTDHDFVDVEEWEVTLPFASSADEGFLTFMHYSFTCSIRPDGTLASVESVDALVVERIGVLMTGPDFQLISMALMPDPSWVFVDPDTIEVGNSGLFTSVVTDPAVRQGQDMTVVLIDAGLLADTGAVQRLGSDGNPL